LQSAGLAAQLRMAHGANSAFPPTLFPRENHRSSRRHIALFSAVVLSFVWIYGSDAAAQTVGTEKCGVERWSVKTLTDKDRDRVAFRPIASSVAELTRLPTPSIDYPEDSRIPVHELRVYRVRAVVRQIISSDDRDWHLVLEDPDDEKVTMIAEIPDSACVPLATWASNFQEARRVLRTAPRRAMVEIDGVGFFDFIHGQRGVAPNGFELHPVLALRVLRGVVRDE
jgi:hypothetical protein